MKSRSLNNFRVFIIEKLGGYSSVTQAINSLSPADDDINVLEVITRLGGFPTIEDAIEAIKAEKNTTHQNTILTLAVKRLFNTITKDDILKVAGNNIWRFENKILAPERVKFIVAEAKEFMSSMLWDILKRDIQYHANRQMFLKSSTEAELTAGKLWLFTVDAIDSRLLNLSQGKGSFPE